MELVAVLCLFSNKEVTCILRMGYITSNFFNEILA